MASRLLQTSTKRLAAGVLAALFGALGASGCGSDPCNAPECGASSGGTSGGGSGRSGPCKSDTNCDSAHGFTCAAGECRYPCSTHFDCQGQGVCDSVTSGDGARLGTYCKLFDTPLPAGQYYTRCPNYTECDTQAGFACLGAGVGDADAYCSGACKADTDCPAGFFCDSVTDSDGNAQLYCVRRRFCASCESDADCLSVPEQLCARDQGGEKICTERCDPNVDSCPWGNAAVCGKWDTSLGDYTCAHRFGSCHGEGKGCEPCVRDSDCPNGLCTNSSYTGERWCIDQSVDCNCDGLSTTQHICSNGNGCPRTPGGLVMSCYDNSRGEGDPIAHKCFGANAGSSLTSPQSGCWGPL